MREKDVSKTKRPAYEFPLLSQSFLKQWMLYSQVDEQNKSYLEVAGG